MVSAECLNNLKVLDVGHYIAGPFCSKVLAAFGAEVVKVEPPRTGDPSRRIGPFFGKGPVTERSGLYFHLNTGKKGVTLNLKSRRGREIFLALVRQADLVVENYRPGALADLGLGYEALRGENPRIVVTSISNFGQTGPYRDWKSSELVSFALGGISYSSYGAPGKKLLKPWGSIAQHMAGLTAALGSLTACLHQGKSNRGQQVDVSIQEVIASLEEHSLPMAAYRNQVRKRANAHPTNHPNITLPCKDGYMHVTTSGANQWKNLCLIAGFPEAWSEDDSPFLNGQYRKEHREEIDQYLLPWLMSHTKKELQELGWEMLLPFAPIMTIPELVKDEQLAVRHFLATVETAYGEQVVLPRIPCLPWQEGVRVLRAPLLGEHNGEVYGDRLGYSREDLVRLHQLGVV